MMDPFGPDRLRMIVLYDPDPFFGGKFSVSVSNRETGYSGYGEADDLNAAIAQAKAQLAEEVAS